MRRILFIFLGIGLIFGPLLVFAAGGGGGGSFFSPPASETQVQPAVTSTTSTTTQPTTSSAPTPKVASDASPQLKCNQPTLAGRVRCRLSLSEAELEAELAKQYLPEECRTLTSGKQETCVTRYRALQPCWLKPVGSARSACAAEKLGLKGTIAAQLKDCLKSQGADRAACQATARDKVFAMIKFRLYDLSERAEALIAKGISRDTVSDLVIAMETNKQSFNTATTYEARLKILNNARAIWKKFVAKTKGKEKITDYINQALADLKSAR